MPEFSKCGNDIEYSRHGSERGGALPIVIVRSNNGIGPPILPEIVQEFRHLMDLRPNADHTEFYKPNQDGSLDPAAKISESNAKIRTKYLRQYQAARCNVHGPC